MIKLIHFIHGLTMGGAETLVKDYVINMDKNKYEVIILCLFRFNLPYEKLLDDNGIKVIYISDYLPLYGKKDFFSRMINYFFRKYYVNKILHEINPDIIHFHLFLSGYIKNANLSHKTRLFYTVHNEPGKLWDAKSRKKKEEFEAAKYLVEHNNMRLIVLHESMLNQINKLFNVKNSIVVNNGIDIARFKYAKKRMVVRNELGISEESFVVGHTGRFVEQKNHDFLIKVFKKIHDKNYKAFLLMVGTGVNKKIIENKLNDMGLNGSYMILSNRTDMPDLLSAMDVFVLPSKFEGLPVSVIEAQLAELPCFISDKVTKKVNVSNLVNYLDIDETPELWASSIVNYRKPSNIIVEDSEWDMTKVVKKLDKIYNSMI